MRTRALLLILAATTAPLVQPAHGQRADTVTIGVEDAAAPWSQADGSGLANDVARAVFAAGGLPVRFAVLPYARCKRMAERGELAGCLSMSREPGLDARIAFPDAPLFTLDMALVVRRGDTRLAPRAVIGIVNGYEYPDAVRGLRAAGHALDVAPSEAINLRKLADGRIDAAIVSVNATKSVAWLARRAGVEGRVAAIATLGTVPAYVGFSRLHPDGARAQAAFTRGMRRIGRGAP